MSQVDGEISITFYGDELALREADAYVQAQPAGGVQGVSDGDTLYLDLDTENMDALEYMVVAAANLPAVGISGVIDLDFIGCGMAYYAAFEREPNADTARFSDRWSEEDFQGYHLALAWEEADDPAITDFLNGFPLPLIADLEKRYTDPGWYYERDTEYLELRLYVYKEEPKQMEILLEELKKLAGRAPTVSGHLFCITKEAGSGAQAFVSIQIEAAQGVSAYVVPFTWSDRAAAATAGWG